MPEPNEPGGEWERYRPHVFDGHPNLDQYTVGVRLAF